jgi:hypothetical protein
MSNAEYSKMLKDPRWQRKRLELMGEAGFKCQECGNESETLNVHHCYYEKGKKPWEYEDGCYLVLCEKCHEKWHEKKAYLDKMIAGKTLDFIEAVTGVVEYGNTKDINRAAFIFSTTQDGIDLLGIAADLSAAIGDVHAAGYKRGKAEAVKCESER